MNNEEIENLLKPKEKEPPISASDWLSSGSTILNLACSGLAKGGFAKGKYHFIVGDSASGKTWLSLTCLAEAAMNPEFDNYRFIYDNVEDGALMDIERFFGTKVAERMEAPTADSDGTPMCSGTVEDFYYNVDDAILEGKPFIYILDSMDSLSSKAEQDKFDEQKTAARKGKTTAGSYGDGKAKTNSSHLRKILPHLRDSKSILIIINQTRDNIGFGFENKTRSGGHALKFYATLEIWSSKAGQLKRSVRGKDREIGINAKIKVKKNRFTGRLREISIPLYHSFGIDDVGSCVDYLIAEKYWTKTKQTINADDIKIKATREKLIKQIQEKGLESEVASLVEKVWNEIEQECAINRQSKYS
jgi:RecA/RadA recombinase